MEFSKTRICFIAVGDKDVRFKTDPSDGRSSKEWAMQDLGLTEKEWEHAVRGYILQGRLQFFTGADYHVTRVPPRVLEAAVEMFESLYDGKPEVYYNGVVPGKEGTVWEPLEVFNISNYI